MKDRKLVPISFVVVPIVMLFTLGASGGGPLSPEVSPGGPANGVVQDHYVVVLEAGASPEAVAGAHGLARRFTYSRVFNGFAAFVPPGRLNDVKADPQVKSVHADRVMTVADHGSPHGQGKGQGKPGGGGGESTSQVIPPNITRVGAAPGSVSFTGSGVGIAIVDTGSGPHGDLNLGSACFDAFVGNCADGHGHGTHVAGIAAALNNTQDVVGVAPDAVVYSVRVLDNSGFGSDSTVIAGLDWVARNASALGIRVANASLGRNASGDDSALRAAVQAVVSAGVLFTAAAGNDQDLDVSQFVPAGFPEAVAVASTTAVDGSNACKFFSGRITADTASYFTTDGRHVLVSTPGEEKENINGGCLISSVGVLSLKKDGGTTRMSGTSMAAPHVAGLGALLAQQSPGDSVACLTTRLESSDRKGVAPLDSPTRSYTFDGEREGIGYAPTALAATCR